MSSLAGTVANPTQPPQETPKLLDAVPFSRFGLLLITLGYAPAIFMHLWNLWSQEQYQYFPFVIAAFVYLLYTRFQQGDPPVPTRAAYLFGRFGMILAWVLLATATLFQSAWLAAVSLNFLLATVLAAISQVRHIKNLWGIWFLLWLLIPLPLGVDTRVIVRLQIFSSYLSSEILDMLRVDHLMFGNVLQLPHQQFFVDEACSGIVSILAVISCGAIYGVWLNRSPIHLVLLITAGALWAISLNVARICWVAIAHAWWNADLSTGRPHEMLGLFLFAITFGALVSTDRILVFLLNPIPVSDGEESRNEVNPLITLWNAVIRFWDPSHRFPQMPRSSTTNSIPSEYRRDHWRLGIPAAFAIWGAISVVPIFFATQTALGSMQTANSFGEDFLPAQLNGLVLTDFEEMHRPAQHELGEYSKVYQYTDPESGLNYFVSIDFPFSGGWHELCVCYKNTGWTLQKRNARFPTAADDVEWPIVTGGFKRNHEFGYVAFSNFNADGDSLSPPNDLIFWRPWRRLRRRMLKTVSSRVFQVQVWVSNDQPLTEENEETADDLLLAVRERFRARFQPQSRKVIGQPAIPVKSGPMLSVPLSLIRDMIDSSIARMFSLPRTFSGPWMLGIPGRK